MILNLSISATGTPEELVSLLRGLAIDIDIIDAKVPDWDGKHLLNDMDRYKIADIQIHPERCFLRFTEGDPSAPPTTLVLSDLIRMDDSEEPENVNSDGSVISEWAKAAEIGEQWTNGVNRYVRVQ